MIFRNTDSNAYKAKIYWSVRRSLYKDEPEFFGLSAIINNLFQWGIAKAEIIPQEFQTRWTEVKSGRQIRRNVGQVKEIRRKLAWGLEHGNLYWKQASKSMSGRKTLHKVNFSTRFTKLKNLAVAENLHIISPKVISSSLRNKTYTVNFAHLQGILFYFLSCNINVAKF